MDIEHNEPATITDPTGVEPTATPAISVNTFETVVLDKGEGNAISDNEQPYTVEGLPVIETETQNEKSDFVNSNENLTPHTNEVVTEVVDIAKDDDVDTRAEEISRQAMELVPNASQELKDAIGAQAAENFKKESEKTKNAEKQEADDAKAQDLLDKLRAGTPLSELLPESTKTPTENQDNTDTLALSTPSSVNTDSGWAAKQL
jgi:hypothetical protein